MERGFHRVGRTGLTSPIRLWLGLLHRQLPHQDISLVYFRASCAWILLLSLLKKNKVKDFFAKTLNDVRLDMGGKVFTATESLNLNRCDTIWDIYAGERVAPHKSPISNRCDTIWNCIVCFFCSVCNKSSFIFIYCCPLKLRHTRMRICMDM